MKTMLSPSLMCMDFLSAGKQLEILDRHMDLLHFDVMDGHFCKNFALSSDFLRAVKAGSRLPVDVHLMVERPAEYLDMFLDAGADYVSLHAETINAFAFRAIQAIQDKKARFGVVVNPATSLDMIREYSSEIDLLTIMTVDPGFAGQPFNTRMLEKIRLARALREKEGHDYLIQADGGVNPRTFGILKEAGVDCFIVGSSGLFGLSPDLEANCRQVRGMLEVA